jgi:hypothetical protein
VLLDQGSNAKALVPPDGSLGDTWKELAFDDAGWISGTTGAGYDNNADYIPLIGLNVDAQMNGINTSVYLRVAFEVADPDAFTSLTLRMKYDDGFVAYLNGVQVAASNQPASLAWNSASTGNPGDAQSLQFVNFSIDQHLGLLNAGANILALQGLNTDLGSSDMLIVPRLEGGSLSGGSAVHLPAGLHQVRARSLENGEWSALTGAAFLVDIEAASAANLVISKVMYHPATPSQAEIDAGFLQASQFEYVELMNAGTASIDLGGARFSEGIRFVFPDGVLLGAGERILVVSDVAAFEFRHGAGLNAGGAFASGNLDDGGERLVLLDRSGSVIVDFAYDDEGGWPEEADGNGYALVLRSPELAGDPGSSASWRLSAHPGGSPASDDRVRSADWRALHFTPSELGDPSVSGDLADADGDGFANVAEFFLGSDPKDPASTGDQRAVIVEDSGGSYLAIEFQRAMGVEEGKLVVEYSDGLSIWNGDALPFKTTPNGDGTATVTWRATAPVSTGLGAYLRLRMHAGTP